MNKKELEQSLSALKKDIEERINSRGMLQGIINKHINTINICIAQNVTIKLIHKYVFTNDDISFTHFKNLIYRARRSNKRKKTSMEVIQDNNTTNCFSALSVNKTIHNNSSERKAADERLQELLIKKKQGQNNEIE